MQESRTLWRKKQSPRSQNETPSRLLGLIHCYVVAKFALYK